MIDDYYKNGVWIQPHYPSGSFTINSLKHEAGMNDCLNSTEASILFRYFNEYGTRRFIKRYMYKVPEPFMRFLDQSFVLPHQRMQMILGIAETRKQTAHGRGGHEIKICSFFGIDSISNCLIAPHGFFVSSDDSIENEESCPINFEAYEPLPGTHYAGIALLKGIAKNIKDGKDISDEDIFSIFCLVQILRTSQFKFSEKNMMESVSVFTGMSRNLITNGNFAVLGGHYAKDKNKHIKSILVSPDKHMLKPGCEITDIFGHLNAFTHNFQPYAARVRSNKRKPPTDEDAIPGLSTDEIVGYLDFSWLPKGDILDYNKLSLDEWKKRFDDRVPKTIEDLIQNATDDGATADELSEIQGLYQKNMQTFRSQKVNEEDATKDALMACMKSKTKLVITMTTPPRGDDHVEHPFSKWTRDAGDPPKNALVRFLQQMIRASLAFTIKKMVVTHRSMTDEEMEQRFTRFFQPHNQDRVLGASINSVAFTNIIKLENAMKMVLNIVLAEPYGKNLAVQAWIMHKDLRWVTDVLIEDDFIIKVINRRILQKPDPQQGPNDIKLYFVPAVVNAMLLFFTRSMAIAAQEKGWNKLPDYIQTSKPCEEWPIPCKSGNLACLSDNFGTISEFMANDQTVKNLKTDAGTQELMIDTMHSNMITSRMANMFLEKTDASNVYTAYSVSKVINAEGEYDLTVSRWVHTFSPYGMFETCDGKVITSQQLANPSNVLNNHPIIYPIYFFTKEIFNNLLSGECLLELKAVPHIETIVKACKNKKAAVNSTWAALKDMFIDQENKQRLNKQTIATIDTALTDISIAAFLVLGKALRDMDNIAWGGIVSDDTLSRVAMEIEKLPAQSAKYLIKEILKDVYRKIGIATRIYSNKTSTIGLSIDNDTLRGIVYVGGIDTDRYIKSGVDKQFQKLKQIPALGCLYCVPIDLKDEMEPNTMVEKIFINPSIPGAENLEPMSNALMHEIMSLKREDAEESEEEEEAA